MRKIKNIAFSLLMVTVIVIGLSSAIFAATDAAEYMTCTDSGVERVAEEFDIPYLRAYASYMGYGLEYKFRAYVWLNVNNTGAQWAYGYPSWSSSGASVVHRPSYPDDTYTWDHGYEDVYDQ